MKGGTRSNKRIFPHSVHGLLPNNANSIRSALERMTPDERYEVYVAVKTGEDHDNIELFESLYDEHYPDEFENAKKLDTMIAATPSWGTATQHDYDRSINDVLRYGPKGGKTRRNRRRRGRRSLKHKHSKRR